MINIFKRIMSTRILYRLLILIMFTGLSPSVVLSLSGSDLNSIYNDTVWYKPNNGNQTCSTTGVPLLQTGLVWPFATKNPSQYNRVDQGWDIQSTPGAPIFAIAAGTVHELSPGNPSGGFGNDYPTEELDSSIGGPSTWIYYGHVHVLPSVVNQKVQAGQQIAVANKTQPENGSDAPPGWLEIGFASPGSDAPIQKSSSESVATQAGQTMKDLLIQAQPLSSTGNLTLTSTAAACPQDNPCISPSLPDISDPNIVADAINKFIPSGSPFKGLGKYFVSGGQTAGVNPFLIAAIANQESSFATNPQGVATVTDGHNAFGRSSDGPPNFYYFIDKNNPKYWYKWSSWQDSIDPTTDPSTNTEQQFVYDRYISQGLNTILDMIKVYAPFSVGNDPTGYSSNLAIWMNQMIGDAGGGVSCNTPAGGQTVTSIVQEALALAWPNPPNTAPDYRDPSIPKPAYVQAPPTVGSGEDCGVFVATVMRASGADPNYPVSGTAAQLAYVTDPIKSSGKYQIIKPTASYDTSNLQPGDILIVDTGNGATSGHTFIWVGTQSGGYNEADASLGGSGGPGRMPSLNSVSSLIDPEGRGVYTIVRMIK